MNAPYFLIWVQVPIPTSESSSPRLLFIFAIIMNAKRKKISNKDEHYVLDLCDKFLGLACSRQYNKFEFLLGDIGKNGTCRKLPVDGYYEKLNLVVEYREKHHTESVTIFDKPHILTVSGIHRGEQRRIYDERRRTLIPMNGLNLVEISYSDFSFNGQKRIIRNEEQDLKVIRRLLQSFI